jgi:hypothetical protein
MLSLYASVQWLLARDPRLLAALSLVVALCALFLGYRLYWTRVQRPEREEEGRRHQREDHDGLLTQFEELHLETDPDGKRRFVWRYPADWPASVDPGGDPISEAERFWLADALWELGRWKPLSWPAERPLNPAAGMRFVYETDAERSTGKRVLHVAQGFRYYLAATPNDNQEPRALRCIKHLIHLQRGSRCAWCNKTAEETDEESEALLRRMREARKRPPS